MEKVIRDGKVAVLISPGYGAGWYTWNSKYPELLFHPSLVQMVEEGEAKDITDEYVKNLIGADYIYAGGAKKLEVVWVEKGKLFRVDEYDGYESIVIKDDEEWIQA